MALAALFAVALGARVAGAESQHNGGGGVQTSHPSHPHLKQTVGPVWHWPTE
jgi:hypothetical protein